MISPSTPGGALTAPPRAIVFDLDGTLYESAAMAAEIFRSAVRYVAGLRGMDEEGARLLLRETKARLSTMSGTDTPLTVACSELGGNPRELHRHFIDDIDPARHLERDQRVVGLLEELRRLCPLYIYTNNNLVLAERILQLLGLDGFMAGIFSIEFSWRPKPDRETLERILAVTGTDAPSTLFVGDRYDIDLRLPASLGAPVRLVTTVPELLSLGDLLPGRVPQP